MREIEIKWEGREDDLIDILIEYDYDEVEIVSFEPNGITSYVTIATRLSQSEFVDLMEGAGLSMGLLEIMDEYALVHNWSYS